MTLTIKVAEHIIDKGKVNMPDIVHSIKEIESYNRAAEILEELEKHQIISPFNGHTPRKVLIDDIEIAKKILTQKTVKNE